MAKFSNAELEIALLGACILKNDKIEQASSMLKPHDFSTPQTRAIWEYLIMQHNAGLSVDMPQLKAALPDISDDFFQILMLQNSYADASSYATSLRDLSIKNQVFNISTQAASELANVREVIEYTHELNAKLYAVLAGISDSSLKTSSQAVGEFYEQFAKMSAMLDKSIVGIDTGYALVNHLTKGFKEGELIVLAARPGQGKTTLALNITLNALAADVGVVFYSLEMPAAQLMSKMIAINTQLPMQDIALANLNDEQIVRMQHSASYLSERVMRIYDKGFLTIETLRASLRRAKEEDPSIGLAVLDYIGLMSFSGGYGERYAQISEISRQLKLLALELQMPILVLSQLNRDVEKRPDKVPVLSDIRDSGSIEQDADMIFFIHPLSQAQAEYLRERGVELEELERPCVLHLAKNRSGETGDVFFDFRASRSTFSALNLSSGAPLSATTI